MTGATGRIGSELTTDLRRRYGDDRVVAAGHSRAPSEILLRSGPFEFLDTTDKASLLKLVEEYDIDRIYHLAALLASAGEKNPQAAWSANMDGILNVLEVAREHKLVRVFWPSAIGVFGLGAPLVNTPQNAVQIPSTMYGVTKVAGELLSNYYNAKFGIDVRSVRYPMIISSSMSPGGINYVVEMFHEAIKKKRYTCFVKESTVLPVMYMQDCIRATVEIMNANVSQIKCRTSYNIAAASFSAKDLATEIKKHISEFKCEYKPDVRQNIVDSWPKSIDDGAARRDWSWKPAYDMAAMANDMIEKLAEKYEAGTL